MSENTRALGAVLRARRIDLGMTQQDLAEELGLPRMRISALETGKFGQARLLFEVATALGLDLVAVPRGEAGSAAIVKRQHDALQSGPKRLRAGRRPA